MRNRILVPMILTFLAVSIKGAAIVTRCHDRPTLLRCCQPIKPCMQRPNFLIARKKHRHSSRQNCASWDLQLPNALASFKMRNGLDTASLQC